jgi:hypothetical protein
MRNAFSFLFTRRGRIFPCLDPMWKETSPFLSTNKKIPSGESGIGARLPSLTGSLVSWFVDRLGWLDDGLGSKFRVLPRISQAVYPYFIQKHCFTLFYTINYTVGEV